MCLLVPVSFPLAEMVGRVHIPRSIFPGVALVAFFPLCAVWLLASIIHRFAAYQAALIARAGALEAQRAQAAMRHVSHP